MNACALSLYSYVFCIFAALEHGEELHQIFQKQGLSESSHHDTIPRSLGFSIYVCVSPSLCGSVVSVALCGHMWAPLHMRSLCVEARFRTLIDAAPDGQWWAISENVLGLGEQPQQPQLSVHFALSVSLCVCLHCPVCVWVLISECLPLSICLSPSLSLSLCIDSASL